MVSNSKNKTDFFEELGALALASRLKRLSERLLKDGALMYRAENVAFEPRWFPVFYLLWRESPLAITEVAQRLEVTHPAVNQVAGAMAKAGLIVSARDGNDDRRRLLSLSPTGRKLARQLQPVWQDVKDAASELVESCGVDLLGAIAKIERSLDKESVSERVRTRRRKRQLATVEIIDYRPRYQKDFKRLNLEWLEKYFSVEPVDKQVLDDPQGQIIDRGGAILFARLDRKIVGTAALIKPDDKTFEIAKMAVTEKARGRQVGRKLTLAALELAGKDGASRVILHTSPKLTAAMSLYHSVGFEEVSLGPKLKRVFRRPTITMQLKLSAKEKIKGSTKQEER